MKIRRYFVMFIIMQSIDPVIFSIYDNLFNHPETMVLRGGGDGCWLTSHIACGLMRERGLVPYEIILDSRLGQETAWMKPCLVGEPASSVNFNMSWIFHVAAACKIGEQPIVFDPLLFSTPATIGEYMNIFPPGVTCTWNSAVDMTYADKCFDDKISIAEVIRRLNRDKGATDYASSYGEPYRGDLTKFDDWRAGPSIRDFVERNLSGARHASDELSPPVLKLGLRRGGEAPPARPAP